jgi:hypothetical protein
MDITCKGGGGWGEGKRPNREKDILVSMLEFPQIPIKWLLLKRNEKIASTPPDMNKCLQLLSNRVTHCINIFIFLLLNYGWLSFE